MERHKDKTYAILGFDMETDLGSWSRNYSGLHEGTPLILESLAKREIKGTFYFTGEAALNGENIVRDVYAAGHEIGNHTMQHETIGEEIFEIPFISPTPKNRVYADILRATEVIEQVSGIRPVSFRCPRLFGSTEVVNSLEKLGYVTDASYPVYHFKEKIVPFHPSAEDWTKEGELNIWEIPNFADFSALGDDEYGRHYDQWPKFRTEGAPQILDKIKSVMNYSQERHGYSVICFYFHPWEFVPLEEVIHNPEATIILAEHLYKNCGPYALQQFELMLDEMLSWGVEFITAKDWADINR